MAKAGAEGAGRLKQEGALFGCAEAEGGLGGGRRDPWTGGEGDCFGSSSGGL